MLRFNYSINCEYDLERFLDGLENLLDLKAEGTIKITIPNERWVDIIFDCIEADEKYQRRGEEPMLDVVFIYMDDAPVATEETMKFLEDLLKEIEDLEEGDDYDDEC